MASDVCSALVLIPDVSARDCHKSNCSYNQAACQDCEVGA
jgi:hypothetical protein